VEDFNQNLMENIQSHNFLKETAANDQLLKSVTF
jgi:hypothetical protein